MNFFASFSRKLGQKSQKHAQGNFHVKKCVCKEIATSCGKNNQTPHQEAIFAHLREALQF